MGLVSLALNKSLTLTKALEPVSCVAMTSFNLGENASSVMMDAQRSVILSLTATSVL